MASLQTDRPATSSTKAQLLDVAEQLFLAHGLGVSVPATSPRPPGRTAPPSTTTSVPATAWSAR